MDTPSRRFLIIHFFADRQQERFRHLSIPVTNVDTSQPLGQKKILPARPLLYLVLIAQGVAGMLLVLYGTGTYGTGISPDSVAYLSTAQNLLAGRGFTVFDGGYYLSWPPLFPLMAALGSALGIDVLHGVRLLNAASFGLIVLFSGYLGLWYLRSKMLVFLAALSVLLSLPLLKVSVMAWSEPLYALLSLAFFLTLAQWFSTRRLSLLLLSSFLVGLACLQRYLGITLLMTGAACLLLMEEDLSPGKRAARALLFILPAATPLLLWLARNYLVAGSLAGHRFPAYYGLGTNTFLAFDVLSAWFLPPSLASVRYIALPLLAVSFILCKLTLYKLNKSKPPDKRSRQVQPIVFYCLVYTVLLILSSSYRAYEPLSDRFFAPIYPFVIILLFVALQDIFHRSALLYRKKMARVLILGLLCLWLLYPAAQTFSALTQWRDEGAGEDFYGRSYYGKRPWQESPLVQWLRNNPLQGEVYSNETAALYILTGIVAKPLADKNIPLERFIASVPHWQDCFLVWFEDSLHGRERFLRQKDKVPSPRELGEHLALKQVVSLPDGSIYQFTQKGDVGSKNNLRNR